MTPTRYAELAYEQHDRELWRIIDTDGQAAVGPQYKSRVELLTDLDRFAREFGAADAGPRLPYPLDDYRNAPSGVGPLAAQWIDKPHRLLYDLCAVLEQARIEVRCKMSQPWRKLSDEAAAEQLHDLIREADLDTLTALYENAFGAVKACEVDLESECLRVLFEDGMDDETLEPCEGATPKQAEIVTGYWTVALTSDSEEMHWGIDGDTQYPFPSKTEAIDQCKFLADRDLHKEDRLYVLTVFANGQILLEEHDRKSK